MRVVMINDCSHTGETLIRLLPKNIDRVHIKRTRGLLEKTVKITLRIFKAKGDIFHCHYLLQDCWLALRLGKHPTIGHAHGSDIRQSIKSPTWGKIVRYNLKECDKIVVSTPNLLEQAKRYNESAEYMPNPVDQNIFYPKNRRETRDKMQLLIASASDWTIRGTDKVIRALKKCENEVETTIIQYGVDIGKTLKLARSLNLHINILSPVTHSGMPEYFWGFDGVIASIGIGGTLGMVALEAIACGRPVIAHVSSKFPEYRDFPLHDVSTTEQIADSIFALKEGKLWKEEYAYFLSCHNPKKIIKRFIQIYNDLIELKKSD